MKTTLVNDTHRKWLAWLFIANECECCDAIDAVLWRFHFDGRFNFVVYPIFLWYNLVGNDIGDERYPFCVCAKWHWHKRVGCGGGDGGGNIESSGDGGDAIAVAIKLIPFQLIPGATCNHCCTWQNNGSTHQIKIVHWSTAFMDSVCVYWMQPDRPANNGLQ